MERSQIRWYFREGVNTIRYEGLPILSWRMLRWGLLPFGELRAITYCRMDLTQPLGEIQANADLIISQATEADIDQLVALIEIRWSPKRKLELFKAKSIKETISEQLKQGAKCFIGKIGTEMVHYNWIFFNRKEYDHYYIKLHDDEALCNDGFTVQEWRGKSIHGAVNNHMLLFLQQAGFHTAYTCVNIDNISSKKGLYRVGWDLYGTLLYFSINNSNKVLMWQLHPPLDPFVPVN
jgi:hypothetical protein